MSVRFIAKMGKKYVKIRRKDWDELQKRLALSLTGDDVALMSRGGGGCEEMCEEACSSAGGCDFTFGDPPECGGFCENGEPWLQEEV